MSTFVGNGGKLDELGFTRLLDELFSPGFAIRTSDAWKVTQSGAGSMNVVIGQGAGLIEYGSTYAYPGWSDSDTTIGVTAADATNPRKDRIVAYIDLSLVLTSVTNNPGALKFLAVAGTPASSPALPTDGAVQTAVGAANPWIELGRLDVPATVTAILTSYITQIRASVGLRAPLIRKIAAASANVTGSLADDLENISTSGGSRTYTLPDATRQAGRSITVRKSDTSTNALVVVTTLSQTIGEGMTTLQLVEQGSFIEFTSDGSNWWITRHFKHPFGFSAYRPAGTTTLVSGTTTLVPLSSELVDNNDDFNTTTYKYIVPFPGTLAVNAAACGAANIGANRRELIMVFVNGVEKARSMHAAALGDPFGESVSKDLKVAKDDEVQLYCYSSVGSQIDGDAAGALVFMSGHMVL